MKGKIVGIFVFMLLICSVLPATAKGIVNRNNNSVSFENTLYVGGSGPGNYTKIQDAIDNASEGNTVFVYDDSSPYFENIYIYKSISLIGENRDSTIINGENGYSVITLSYNSITCAGFTLKNIGNTSVGIFVDGANGCLINDNKVIDLFTGIRFFNTF
jgi:pectin methylesterase-like acyl-CoA thioesterase